MRKVLRNSEEVFHYWANQVQSEGRCGNVSFDKDVIYSYAAPIARLFPNLKIVLISDRKWSITTTGHQYSARRSLSDDWTKVYAPFVDANPHSINKDAFERRFMTKLNLFKLHPRRKTLLQEANQIRARYEAYRAAFKLDWPDLNPEALAAQLEAEELEAKERADKFQAEAEKKRLARIVEQEESLVKWRVRELVRYPYFEKTALRLSEDGTHIETTRGAAVPTRVAARLWPLACSCRANKSEYHPALSMNVGVYTLNWINVDGSMLIGCHNIPWDELALMAEKLGLPPYSDTLVPQTVTEIEEAA